MYETILILVIGGLQMEMIQKLKREFAEADARGVSIGPREMELRYLIGEVERYQEEAYKAKKEAMNEREQTELIVAEREELYAEVERLQDALKWYTSDECKKMIRRFYFGSIEMDEIGNVARKALEATKP